MAVTFEVEGKRQDTSTEAYLVDKILAMIVAQLLRAYDTVHVCLHQLLHNPNTQTHFVSNRFPRALSACPRGQSVYAEGAHLDEVDLAELGERRRAQDVEDSDDVFVVKMPEQLDLAQGAETEHGVVEGRDALDCDLATGRYVHRRAGDDAQWMGQRIRSRHNAPYNPVCTLTYRYNREPWPVSFMRNRQRYL